MIPGDSFTFSHKGLRFRAYIEHDDDANPPWEEADGHGPVSDWFSRPSLPGEWVLASDRYAYRYYDAAAALEQAKKEGWGLGPDDVEALATKLGRNPTQAQIREEAVRRDFEYLRGWCNQEWCYVGVCVVLLTEDGDEIGDKYSAAVWRIESNCDDYIRGEVCPDLAEQALSHARTFAEKVMAALAKSN